MAAWVRGLAAVFLLLAVAQGTGIQDGLNRRLTDVHAGWRARAQPVPFPDEIVVVAIDDRSISRLGRVRYWSRQQYAELLDRLGAAKAVGFDILFAEADRDPAGDAALGAAMARHGRVVVPYYQWKETRPLSTEAQRETEALLARLPTAARAAPYGMPVPPSTLEPPIRPLLESAAGLGYADVNADPDGVYRAPALLKATTDGRPLVHFTVALAALAARTDLQETLTAVPGAFSFGGRTVPLEEGALLLRPLAVRGGGYGHTRAAGQPVPTVSFVEALEADPEQFRNKIVLIGETATGTPDIRPTALDNGLRGVELNAEMVANLLHVPPLRALPLALQWPLILLAAGLPLWLFTVLPPSRASLGAGTLLLAAVGVMEGAYWTGNMVPLWSPALLGVLGSTLAMGVQRAAQEHAQKQRFRERFSQYVSPKLVQRIERNRDMAAEEGRRQRLAVLFSDVRGFTTYTEQHPAELVVRQMREYLDEMAAAVDEFDGVLDKFVGDAVMGLYGPFLEGEQNLSARALASALNMIERLERLNKKWAEDEMPVLRIGIGIHVGEAIFGEIGTARRQQLTALGDTVNLAARLESATKEFGAALLVSQAAMEEAEPVLGRVVRFIDRGTIPVKGREQPVHVYEVRRRPAGAAGAAAAPEEGPGNAAREEAREEVAR
jgi:adenylate cyclase